MSRILYVKCNTRNGEMLLSRMTIMSLWVVSMEKNNTLSRQRQLNSDAILEIFHYSAPSSQICLLYKNVFYFIFYSNLNFLWLWPNYWNKKRNSSWWNARILIFIILNLTRQKVDIWWLIWGVEERDWWLGLLLSCSVAWRLEVLSDWLSYTN